MRYPCYNTLNIQIRIFLLIRHLWMLELVNEISPLIICLGWLEDVIITTNVIENRH